MTFKIRNASRPIPHSVLSAHYRFAFRLCALLLLWPAACAYPPPPVPVARPVLFPPPPEQARVQYLGSISSPRDFATRRAGFAEFILGPEEERLPLAKPIAATLFGTKLFVCDTVLNTVIVYDLLTGDAHRLAGDSGVGKIRTPNSLAVGPMERIYVADKARGAVLVYSRNEQFVDAWGRPDQIAPVSVAVSRKEVFVCDIKDHEIEVYDRVTGKFLRAFGGQGAGPGKFAFPTHITLDAEGNLFVSDTANFRVQKLSPKGEPLAQFGHAGQAPGCLAWPKGIAVDDDDRLYVADSRFANVQIFDREGRLLLFFGGPGPEQGNLDLPAGVFACPWPPIPWLDERLVDKFKPEYLVIVVNQWRGNLVNFFAVANDKVVRP